MTPKPRGRPPLPPDQRRPKRSGPSGRHAFATAGERAASVALLAQLAALVRPDDPSQVTVASLDRMLALPKGTLLRAVAPRARRMSERVRSTVLAEIGRRSKRGGR